MSSIVHKVKDAITPSHKTSAPEGSHGPHSSRVANAADPRIDSDRDGRAAHTTTTGAHDYSSSDNYTYGSNTTGTHGSGIPEGVAGPHKTRVANAADPRIDSDLDRSRNMGANPSGTSTTGTHTTGVTGTSGLNNHSTTHGTAPVHNSNVANKLDPRTPATGASTGLTGNTHTTGTSGLTNHSTTHGTGPVHNSNVANKLDPRVNASNTATTGTTGSTGMTGAHGTTTSTGLTGAHGTHNSSLPEGTTGPHSSRVANAADPRIDSDADRSRNMGMNTGVTGTHGTHGTTGYNNTSGPGPAPSTAGPHKSDALNKADPRVDSDLNGSKTIGGDKTYSRPADSSAMAYKDPTDAAQVPPSVLQKHTRQDGHHGL